LDISFQDSCSEKGVLSGTAADLANDPQVQKVYLGTG
jgi:hypothetical protein